MQKDNMIVEMIFFCNKEDCCKAKQDIFHLILGITIQEQWLSFLILAFILMAYLIV